MHNWSCFWKPFGSESVNESQKVLQYAEKNFYPTFSFFCAKLSSKKFFLIRYKILGVPDNTLTANYEYSRINGENLPLPNSTNLSRKP